MSNYFKSNLNKGRGATTLILDFGDSILVENGSPKYELNMPHLRIAN